MDTTTITHISVPRSAVGHIIGRNGMTIQGIRNEHNVAIHNSNFNHDTKTVTFVITGSSENVEGAYTRIQKLIDISNEWCSCNSYGS